jgi:hypothetical protein
MTVKNRAPAERSEPSISTSRLDVFDCTSIFDFTEHAKTYLRLSGSDAPVSVPSFEYRAAFDVLKEWRHENGFDPADRTLAFASVDPESDGQSRFVTALIRMNILVEAIDFRHAAVTVPLVGDSDTTNRRYIRSVSANIAYVLGLLAAQRSPDAVIVTRSFEIFEPLRDFVERRGGKAAIAFFKRFIDGRYAAAGLFDADSPINSLIAVFMLV